MIDDIQLISVTQMFLQALSLKLIHLCVMAPHLNSLCAAGLPVLMTKAWRLDFKTDLTTSQCINREFAGEETHQVPFEVSDSEMINT